MGDRLKWEEWILQVHVLYSAPSVLIFSRLSFLFLFFLFCCFIRRRMFTYSSGRVISYYYPHESIFFIIKSRANAPLVTEQLLLRQPFPLPRLTFNFFSALFPPTHARSSAHPAPACLFLSLSAFFPCPVLQPTRPPDRLVVLPAQQTEKTRMGILPRASVAMLRAHETNTCK